MTKKDMPDSSLSPLDLPAIRAIPLIDRNGHRRVRVLTNRQREEIAAIAARVNVHRRTIVYREHAPAESVFIVARGALKAFRNLPTGKGPVLAFLFAEDIFGLSESGVYMNTVQAVTDATLFRIPIVVLKDALLRDARLQFGWLAKVTHELREEQRHTILVERRDAAGRFAMFLRTLEDIHVKRERGLIDIPMSRSDVADYLGLTSEALSRASRTLERNGIVVFVNRHTARVVDRGQFDRLAAGLSMQAHVRGGGR